MDGVTPLITWHWPETPMLIGVILVGAVVTRAILLRAIRMAVDASVKHAKERNKDQGSRAERILAAAAGADNERHEARTRTIGAVLRSLTTVLVALIAVLTILDALGVPLGPIVASAGIGGAALVFGAQSLVKDFLSGIFMIMEDQYGVGDLVDTGEVTGTVEDVGLRVTRLRDANGQVWYVRNGQIMRVGNQSQGWSTAIVDIPVAYNEDAAHVLAILEKTMEELFAQPSWDDIVLEPPNVAGVDKVVGGSMIIRIFAKCAPNKHWGIQREILERGQAALQAAGVRGPIISNQ